MSPRGTHCSVCVVAQKGLSQALPKGVANAFPEAPPRFSPSACDKSHIPGVYMTADTTGVDELFCFSLGLNFYINKNRSSTVKYIIPCNFSPTALSMEEIFPQVFCIPRRLWDIRHSQGMQILLWEQQKLNLHPTRYRQL